MEKENPMTFHRISAWRSIRNRFANCSTAGAHGRPDRRPGPRPHYHEFSCPLERQRVKEYLYEISC